MKRPQERLDDLALVSFVWVIGLSVVAVGTLVALTLAHGGQI